MILLGAFMTDINLGIYTAHLDPARCIDATSETLRISRHHYDGVLLADFLDGLIAAGLKAPPRALPARPGDVRRGLPTPGRGAADDPPLDRRG